MALISLQIYYVLCRHSNQQPIWPRKLRVYDQTAALLLSNNVDTSIYSHLSLYSENKVEESFERRDQVVHNEPDPDLIDILS